MGATTDNTSGNSVVVQPIPAGARDLVHSLKEIVNCSDAEIYAALKECSLDPNEAVNRLLTQDPFREVKCKREKKKEGKDNTEAKARNNGNLSRSTKSSSESQRHFGRHSSTQYTSSESYPGKPVSRKENASSHASHLLSVSGTVGHTRNRAPIDTSDVFSSESRASFVGANDSVRSAKGSWITNQVSMADILKMGRQHNGVSNDQSNHIAHGNLRYSQDHDPKNPAYAISSRQDSQSNGEWPAMKQRSAATSVSDPEWNIDEESPIEGSGAPSSLQTSHRSGHYNVEKLSASEMLSEPIVSVSIQDDGFRDPSFVESNMYKNMRSYQHQSNGFDDEVEENGESVSSLTQTLQHLSVNKDDQGLLSDGYVTSVVIPDHLQVTDVDCSHLSFGSFGAGLSIGQSPVAAKSVPLEQDPSIEPAISSFRHADVSFSKLYDDGSQINASNGGFFQASVHGTRYDPQVSQSNDFNHETTELAHGAQYSFASANSGYEFNDLHDSTTTYSGTSSQIQEHSPFSNARGYADSYPGVFSSVNVHPARELDARYSSLPSTQLMPDKYRASASSIGSSMVAPENLTTVGSSPAEAALPSVSGATLSALSQNSSVNPYSHPNLPFGQLANLITYPSYLPQNYTYLPSAFQQSFTGNGGYPQSMAGTIPQYKNMISSATLPQYTGIAPGYGAFGNSTSMPVDYPMNPTAAPSGTNSNVDNVLLSLLQQNELLQGQNSRTLPAVPSNSFYNYQANQQAGGGFRQTQQQPSQNYGGVGIRYSDSYNSHPSFPSEATSQNARDICLGGSQVHSKQAQLWQNGGY